MARLKHKFIDDIPADKIIESSDRHFVNNLHLEILNNSALPEVNLTQYDDSEIRGLINSVNSDTQNLIEQVNTLKQVYVQIGKTLAAMSNKYDTKSALVGNITGYTFTDSLVGNSYIASYKSCAYDNSRDSIK